MTHHGFSNRGILNFEYDKETAVPEQVISRVDPAVKKPMPADGTT